MLVYTADVCIHSFSFSIHSFTCECSKHATHTQSISVWASLVKVWNTQVWVLTGDKVETAVNIAYSCGHFKRFMTILTLTGLHDKETADIQLQEYRWV